LGLVLAATFGGLAACETALSPSGPPSGDSDGKWGWEFNGNPAGSYTTFTLRTAGTIVSGTGGICGIGPNCIPGPVTITGEHVPGFGPFTLRIKGGAGYVATYAGQFVGNDQLRGTWTEGSHSGTVVLNRCTATSFC
jgi:hypothetical protein